MPTLSFRVSDDEAHALQSEARSSGLTLSDLLRRKAQLSVAGVEDRVEDHERRIVHLEGVAGLA